MALTKEQWSQILSAVNSSNIKELAQQYGITESSIYKKMKASGISTRNLLESQWDEILSQVDKISPAELSRRYDVTAAGIHYQIKKRGIPYKPFVQRKHQFDEDFFENIDTEAKAYWLGFIMADGCIEQPTKWGRPKRLKIQLSAIDKEHLQKFLADINADIEVEEFMPHESTYGTTPMCRIQINSVKMCSDLAKYGITRNKTGNESMPELPGHLMRHFIRGYFDGDGSVTFTEKSSHIGFTSSREFLTQLRDHLYQKIRMSNRINPIPSGKGTGGRLKHSYQMGYTREADLFLFYHYIYDNSTTYLERKYVKYSQLIS